MLPDRILTYAFVGICFKLTPLPSEHPSLSLWRLFVQDGVQVPHVYTVRLLIILHSNMASRQYFTVR